LICTCKLAIKKRSKTLRERNHDHVRPVSYGAESQIAEVKILEERKTS